MAVTDSDVMGAVSGGDATKALFKQRADIVNAAEARGKDLEKQAEITRGKIADSRAAADKAATDTGALTPPRLDPIPEAKATDLLTQFGSPAMFIAALGSRLTRAPLTSSLNASAAVLNAYKQKDAAAAQQQYDIWKTNTDNALKLHEFQMDAYKAALSKADKDQNAALAEFTTYASAFKDSTALMMARVGGIDGAISYQDAMARVGVELRNAAPKLEEAHQRMQALAAVTKARDDLSKAEGLAPDVVAAKTRALQDAVQHLRDVNESFSPAVASTALRGEQALDLQRQRHLDKVEELLKKPEYDAYRNYLVNHPNATPEEESAFIKNMKPSAGFDAVMAALGGGAMPKSDTPKPATPAKKTYAKDEIIERGGKKYRVVGGDPSDPDVEEIK